MVCGLLSWLVVGLTAADYQTQSLAGQRSSASSQASCTLWGAWSAWTESVRIVTTARHVIQGQTNCSGLCTDLFAAAQVLDIPEHLLHKLFSQQDLHGRSSLFKYRQGFRMSSGQKRKRTWSQGPWAAYGCSSVANAPSTPVDTKVMAVSPLMLL